MPFGLQVVTKMVDRHGCNLTICYSDGLYETVQLPKATDITIYNRVTWIIRNAFIWSVQDSFWVNFFQNLKTVHEWTTREKWSPQTLSIAVEFMNFLVGLYMVGQFYSKIMSLERLCPELERKCLSWKVMAAFLNKYFL